MTTNSPGYVRPSSLQSEKKSQKLVELDSLRGLMALWVFLTHVLFISGLSHKHGFFLLSNGSIAVSVFMMLSGFAISNSLLHSNSTYLQYMGRRIARIYPIYLVGLAVGVVTSAMYPPLLEQLGWINPDEVARLAGRVADEHSNFWPHLVSHLLLAQGLIPSGVLNQAPLSFNGAAWSLSLEMQFYVVAPALVAVLLAPREKPVGVTILIVAGVAGLFVNSAFPIIPCFLPQSIGYFIIGILTAIHLDDLARRPTLLLQAAIAFSAAALFVGNIGGFVPAAIWVWVIVACSLRQSPLASHVRRALSLKPMLLFGEASYGFYLIHIPILIVWGQWLANHYPMRNQFLFAAALSGVFPVITILSMLSYRYFESPINSWAKRRFKGVNLVSVRVIT